GEALGTLLAHLLLHAVAMGHHLAADDVAVLVGIQGIEIERHARAARHAVPCDASGTIGAAAAWCIRGAGLLALCEALCVRLLAGGLGGVELGAADAAVLVGIHVLDAAAH